MSGDIVRPARDPLPVLSSARVPLTSAATVTDPSGQPRQIQLAGERPLTLYVDRHELVTLMTLGQEPELLALGYLLNQGLVVSAHEVESITVDWQVSAAAARTRHGVSDFAERIARRTVTTGCGQGTVFGEWIGRVPPLPPFPPLPPSQVSPATLPARVTHDALVHLLQVMRNEPSVHRDAGSVHGTALWRAHGARPLVHVEDVGRHNAVDTIAGWMAMHGVAGDDCWLYTTGRLTSEMVLKAAHLRIPVVISRNGATAMGQELAQRLNVTLIGRANGQRYLCYSGAGRLVPARELPLRQDTD